MFGRYMVTFDEQLPGWPKSGNVLTTRPEDAAQKHQAHSLTMGDTMVFGSNMVNSFRVAWNRTKSHYHLEPFFGAETIGIKGFHNYVPGVMGLAISGGVPDRLGRLGLLPGRHRRLPDVRRCHAGPRAATRLRSAATWRTGRTTRSTASAASDCGRFDGSVDRHWAWRTSSPEGWPGSSMPGPACWI